MTIPDREQQEDVPQAAALDRCSEAKRLEDMGEWEAARDAMGPLWAGPGRHPELKNLGARAKAEVLLRAGALTGRLGQTRRLAGSQKAARELLDQSISLFKSLNENARALEAAIESAQCYYLEGALNAARATLREVLSNLPDECTELRASALMVSAMVEYSANNPAEVCDILTEASALLASSGNHLLRGNVHNNFGVALWALGRSSQSRKHFGRAMEEYKAARFHFETAGNTRNIWKVENNMGLLHFELAVSGLGVGGLDEALQHLGRALSLAEGLQDEDAMGRVNESLARVFLAQGRLAEAEGAILKALELLGKGWLVEALSEALRTHGVILARLGRFKEAAAAHDRAIELVAASRIKPVDL